MSISNTELRRKVFGGDTSGHAPRPVRLPAITNPFAGIADLWLNLWRRMAEALSQAFPQEIGGETRKTPLAERLAASAKAKVRFEPTGRLAFADTARGIAVLLAVFMALAGVNGHLKFGFALIDGAAQFLHPFAIPAFLVLTGMFLRRSREATWAEYVQRKIGPLALALALWFAAVAMLAQSQIIRGGGTGWLAGLNYLHLAVLLTVLPGFLLAWRALHNFRTGTVFVLAAIMEILHTEYGGIVWIEAMRGMVYLAAGHCFADKFRALARFARGNRPSAFAILGVWAAFNALMVYADVQIIAGEKISTLPFASLAIGLAGAAALMMAGEILSATPVGASLATIGRKWIAVYAILPLTIVVLANVLESASLFATQQEAVFALMLALVAAAAAYFAADAREAQPLPAPARMRKL